MLAMSIILEGDGAFSEEGDRIVEGTMTKMALLTSGMVSGRPSIGIIIEMPDGTAAFAQTSLRMLLTACDAFKAKHGDPRLDDVTKGEPS
jgi:hypothetical protein